MIIWIVIVEIIPHFFRAPFDACCYGRYIATSLIIAIFLCLMTIYLVCHEDLFRQNHTTPDTSIVFGLYSKYGTFSEYLTTNTIRTIISYGRSVGKVSSGCGQVGGASVAKGYICNLWFLQSAFSVSSVVIIDSVEGYIYFVLFVEKLFKTIMGKVQFRVNSCAVGEQLIVDSSLPILPNTRQNIPGRHLSLASACADSPRFDHDRFRLSIASKMAQFCCYSQMEIQAMRFLRVVVIHRAYS